MKSKYSIWSYALSAAVVACFGLGFSNYAGAKEKLKYTEVYPDGQLSVYEGEEITVVPGNLAGAENDITIPGVPGSGRPPRGGTPGPGDGPIPLPGPGAGPGETDHVKEIEKIINLGEKIWKIIEANRPVVDSPTKSASALPNTVKSGIELENWQLPKARAYRISYTNWYGLTVVDYTFRIVYTYGGSLDGTGKYLNNISVVPSNLEVSWGYSFKSEVEVADPVNLGTKTNPVAGVELRVIWKVDTVMKHQTKSLDLFIEGDGKMTVMN